VNPDRLAEMEEERRFLLRSLTDLERERQAGDVEEHDYVTLRDGYTARAATVLRAIDEGHTGMPKPVTGGLNRRIVTIVGVLVVALVAGWMVASSSGQRLNGESLTGGTSPDRITVLLSQARDKLGADMAGASDLYRQVLDLQPQNAEAQTYTGWLLAISVRDRTAEEAAPVLQAAKETLQKAIANDPTYADPHCFLAVIIGRFENDPAGAVPASEDCLANNPPSQMRGLIESMAADFATTVTTT
jgi:hypothetical protein